MKRIIGLDMGDVRIGVAASDPMGILASGVECYCRKNTDEDFTYIAELVKRLDAELFVIGLPKNMNGTLGPQAEKYMDFGRKLEKLSGVKVVFHDERLTSSAANRVLIDADVSRSKRKGVVDVVAAQLILQNYLDMNK